MSVSLERSLDSSVFFGGSSCLAIVSSVADPSFVEESVDASEGSSSLVSSDLSFALLGFFPAFSRFFLLEFVQQIQ